jgi:hypothetical protein
VSERKKNPSRERIPVPAEGVDHTPAALNAPNLNAKAA